MRHIISGKNRGKFNISDRKAGNFSCGLTVQLPNIWLRVWLPVACFFDCWKFEDRNKASRLLLLRTLKQIRLNYYILVKKWNNFTEMSPKFDKNYFSLFCKQYTFMINYIFPTSQIHIAEYFNAYSKLFLSW